MTLAPESTFGRYRLVSLLGRGGMGEVYLALDAPLGRRVALKLLRPELAADETFRLRFEAEGQLAAGLDHPHVLPVYEAGELEGRLFLAMRYVPGLDLASLLAREERLPLGRVQTIVSQLADALDAAHAAGLVHRDVKPANVLLAPSQGGTDHVYLADFGLARHGEANRFLTRPGQLIGSADYVAPELLAAAPATPASDLYALGCLAFECLAGQPPFRRDTELATLWAHAQAAIPSLTEQVPELPVALDPAIARALAKESRVRYDSGAAFARALADAGLSKSTDELAQPRADAPAAPMAAGLPTVLSSFVGRDAELAALDELLGSQRLVTVTGPGGIGKTRLALEAARGACKRFRHGAAFVELAGVRSPELVLPAIASALEVPMTDGRQPADALATALADRQVLLVLDNFEQIVSAAPEVSTLLERCAGLCVLVTSRVPLHLRGEREYPVPPLSLAEVDDSARTPGNAPAVRLFIERAEAVHPGRIINEEELRSIEAICRRLDGLPLAIELAAAQVRLMPPRVLLHRLEQHLPMPTMGARDLPRRQRTLRDAIGWSFDLLPLVEQRLFRRLGIFAGSFGLSAAEAVCRMPGEQPVEVLDGVAMLADHSLLSPAPPVADEPRFRILETIREFALEQLVVSGEQPKLRQRHLSHFAGLVTRAESGLTSKDQHRWLAVLAVEHDNIRGALRTAVELEQAEIAQEVASSLRTFWHVRGHVGEARRWLAEVSRLTPGARTKARCNALHALGNMAYVHGDFAEAETSWEEALDLARTLEQHNTASGIVGNLGMLAMQAGRAAAAERLFTESMTLATVLEDSGKVGRAAENLGLVALELRGRLSLAERHFRRALGVYTELGDKRSVAIATMRLGLTARLKRDLESSDHLLRAALAISRRLEDHEWIGWELLYLSQVELDMGHLDAARSLLAEAFEANAVAEGRILAVEMLEHLGAVRLAEGRPSDAVRCWAAADGERRERGMPLPLAFRKAHEANLDVARRLDSAAFDSAWNEGRQLGFEATNAAARY